MNPTTLAVWRFIAQYVDQHGYPPTCREIAAGCYLASSSSAFYHLGKLQAEGILQRERRSARNYRLMDAHPVEGRGQT